MIGRGLGTPAPTTALLLRGENPGPLPSCCEMCTATVMPAALGRPRRCP